MIKFRLVIQPQVQVQVQTRLGIVHILSLEQNKAGNALAAAALMHHGNLNVIVAGIIIGQLQMVGFINHTMMNGGNGFIVTPILLKYIQRLLLGKRQVQYAHLIVILVKLMVQLPLGMLILLWKPAVVIIGTQLLEHGKMFHIHSQICKKILMK
jgi:predicted transcriptional regulator